MVSDSMATVDSTAIAIPRAMDRTSRPFAEVPRAASYTHLARSKDTTKSHSSPLASSRPTFSSEFKAVTVSEDGSDASPPEHSSGWSTPDEPVMTTDSSQPEQDDRDTATDESKSAKIASSDASQDNRSSLESRITSWSMGSWSKEGSVSTAATTPTAHTPRASVTSDFDRRAKRRSWIGASSPSSSSRSPSPEKGSSNAPADTLEAVTITPPLPARTTSRKKSFIQRKSSTKVPKVKKIDLQDITAEDARPEPESRKSGLLRRKSNGVGALLGRTPSMENLRVSRSKTPVPAMPPIPKSFSTDRLPLKSQHEGGQDVPPVPRLIPSDHRHAGSGANSSKKKDPLWSAFRDLDGDYAKFSSKTLAFKTNVVRQSVLPFLRENAKHPSNWTLRPEDLDRRANILNKWWTGLIEMLHGRNNQSIAGTDRPAILDGVSGIMDRPEWRLAPSPFSPLAQRENTPTMMTMRSPSDLSTTSTTSEFLAESVHHNVRNIFIQNLRAQVVFAVDKMGLRNAPASLVNFCGKACAYAFMFVPGMADVLVRLWELPVDSIRRVLAENGVGKFDDVSSLGQNIVTGFPPAIQPLGFSSLMKYMRRLRTPPPLPLGTVNVQWWGPWNDRWAGRESDLFYVFVKHFHILTAEFLPPDPSKKERACAPGFILVQAQILTNLDATIHRQSNQNQLDPAFNSLSTFDDILGDPDAIAPTLPVPPTNAVRVMAENRLIMLIRDFLSERAAEHPLARQIFAESFNDVLQSAARGTSIFDHAACYTLLDFLEEALLLLVRYERFRSEDSGTLIDGAFWQDVSRKMLMSQNTMTEIRLYSFLYTVWTSVVSEGGWKVDLCKDFLLDPDVFATRFNHWCPMVRAYYMRLLCWRVGRYDGDASNCDLEILEMLLERLQTTWANFLYVREQAEVLKLPAPSTSPCNPAPSRRLVIVRTDGTMIRNPALLSFDGILPPSKMSSGGDGAMVSHKRNSTISLFEIDTRPTSPHSTVSDDSESPRSAKSTVGGFLRNLMGSSKKPASQTSTPSPPSPTSSEKRPSAVMRSATDTPSSSSSAAAAAQQEKGLRDRPASSLSMRSPSTTTTPPTSQSQTNSTSQQNGSQQYHRTFTFKFSLDFQHPSNHTNNNSSTNNYNKPLPPMRLLPPRLPMPAQHFLHESGSPVAASVPSTRPATGTERFNGATGRYTGRALAEWNVVLSECQSFFDRRKAEGVPGQGNRGVETPGLGVEVFRRPG